MNKAFTLISLLMAITMIALLTISSVVVIPPMIEKAHDATRKSDLHKIKVGLEEYYDSVGQFPDQLPDCGQALVYHDQNFINSVPCDPVFHEQYYYQPGKGDRGSFRLYTKLSNEQDLSIADVKCDGGCGPDCLYNYGVSSTNVDLLRCSYVCAPGGGSEGTCELYQNPELSDCPILFGADDSCDSVCRDPKNRCKDASGKNVPF